MQTFDAFLSARCVREPILPAPGTRLRLGSMQARLAPSVRAQLVQLVAALELARAAVVASVGALRDQNCEIDADIASLLQRHVGDVLGMQIEKAQELLALFDESR